MKKEEIKEKVIEMAADLLGVEKHELTDEANFQMDLGADSLDQVELVMEIEKEFNIAISDNQAEKVTTVAEMVNLTIETVNK
ncbi:MAG: acyl carrier protein [Bacteroidetes bacterium]|nr:acyl carrier protein [Bacteroidota bacterium]